MRLSYPNGIGMFARIAQGIGKAGGDLGGIDIVSADNKTHDARRDGACAQPGTRGRDRGCHRGHPGSEGRQRLGPGVPAAPGWQDRHSKQGAADDAGHAVDGLHAGRGAGVPGDRRGPTQGVAAHDQGQLRGGGQRRDRGAGPGRHRPGGRHAGDGRQGDAVQGIRRHRRLPDLPATRRTRTRSWRR